MGKTFSYMGDYNLIMNRSLFVIGFALLVFGVLGLFLYYPFYQYYSSLVVNAILGETYKDQYNKTMYIVIASVVCTLTGLALWIYAIFKESSTTAAKDLSA